MSRIAQLLEVKSPVDGITRDAQYQAAMSVYLGKTGRENTKVLIIDPTAKTKLSKQVVRLPGAVDGADPREFLVVGLDGRGEKEVLSEIYRAIGEGYVVCFADDDGKSDVGLASDLSVKKIPEEEVHYTLDEGTCTRLGIPSDFVRHMQRLQAFSDHVAEKKGLDKVDVAGETWSGTVRNGSLYDSTDGERNNATAILAAYYGLTQIQEKLAKINAKSASFASQDNATQLRTLEAIIALTDEVGKEIFKATQKIPPASKISTDYAKSIRSEIDSARGEYRNLAAENQKAVLHFVVSAAATVGPMMPNIQSADGISKLELESAILAEEVKLKAVGALVESTAKVFDAYSTVNPNFQKQIEAASKQTDAEAMQAALTAALTGSTGYDPALRQAADFQKLREDYDNRMAALVAAKAAMQERADAGAHKGDAEAAKKAQQEESATHHLLTVGFYSKDRDLSHVFAEKGLDAYKSSAPVAGTRYAGAFTLPAPTDKTAASLNPLEAALNTAKQKIESTAADKITLPVTLRFLMHAPGNPGHETVLDVAIDATKKITITHFDSLLPVGTSQSHSSFPAAVLTKIQGVFNAGYTLDPVRQAANPIGTQPAGSVECVYFAVAEIAKNYEPAAKLPLPATGTALDEASKATMKLAVTKLMADAEQSAYMLAHADKAITEPLRTVCVEPTELKSATEADAAKYNVVPGLEALKAGDVIYPVILENKRLAHEINQKAAATTGDVKALQADAAFIQLCGDLIKNNAPAEPALNSLNSAAQRVLVELMVMNAHRQAIVLAVPQAVGSITIADRANVQDVVKNAVTPFDLENNAVKALNKGEAGRELLKGFSAVVKTAQDDCQKRLAALTATKNDADKKADSTDTKKTTTTTEGGDAFKKLDVEARKKVMSSLSSEMKKTFTLPSQFKKVEFEVVKQKNKQTGQTENAISVEKTADKDECRVTLSVTVTKTDKAQAEKPVDVTLVRTVIGEKVERKCETTSDLVDWKTQCALMAAASIAERKEVAKLESTADKKVEPDLNIQVAIKNSGSAVPGQLIGGVKRDGFSHDEAIMINAYLEAGFKRVQCQGVDFYPAGQTKASSYVLTESKPGSSALASVAKGLPPVKSPDVATSAPDQKDRPPIEGSKTGAKKGLCINFKMQFSDPKAEAESKATERGLTETEQAHAILKNALALHKKGYAHVGITYSANQDETQKVLAHNSALHAGKTGADVPAMPSFGAHQGSVMNEVVRLLSADPAYQSIQSVFRIVPMTTMKYVENNKVALADQKSVDQSIQYLNAFIAGGGALLRWQNQHTRPDHCALGGGVAKEMPESDKAAHKVQLAQMQDALRKQMDPAPTKAATPAA